MKYTTKNKLYPLLMLCTGAAGAFARFAMYRSALDSQGMLPRNHPLDILCWVLTAVAAVIAVNAAGQVKDTDSYGRSFPKKRTLLIPAGIAAAGLLITLLQGLWLRSKLHLVWLGLGFASVPALLVIGWQRTKGQTPVSWLYSILCLFYGTHLICCYQSWSGNPQLPDYSFQLLACGALILASYQRSAFSAGLGKRRMHLVCSLLAGFFCILCSAECDFPWLYLTHGIFFLCDLTFRNKRRKHIQE